VSETQYWTDYFEDVLEDNFAEYGIQNVETYGNTWMLMATGASALACSALLVLEAFLSFCCQSEEKSSNDSEQMGELPQKESLPTVESTEHNSSSRDCSMSDDDASPKEEAASTDDANKQPSWAMNTWSNPFYH
jgi:hypothetical protein